MYLTLTYRKNLDAPDVTFLIEQSDDLIGWDPAIVADTTTVEADTDGDGTAETVKIRVDVNNVTKAFLRLSVSRP